jgi:hypothetical protein
VLHGSKLPLTACLMATHFQRQLGAAVAAAARPRLVQDGVVAVRQAAPRPAAPAASADFSAKPARLPQGRPRAGRHRQDRRLGRLSERPGRVNHEPHVVGPMAAHVILPWVHRAFANLKTWACAAPTSRPTSTS